MPEYLLVSPARLAARAQDSLSLDVEADGVTAVEAYLATAQARVEEHLNRRLTVGTHAVRGPWGYSHQRAEYAAWAPEWPVIDAPDGVTVIGRRLYASQAIADAEVVAGYRAIDQDEGDFPDLGALPPALPADIEGVIVEIALLHLRAAREGTLGSGRKTQQVGQSVVTVETADTQAESRALRRLVTHRRVL